MVKKQEVARQPLKMVDISDKPVVKRTAEAEGKIWLQPETIKRMRRGSIEKGDVLSAANIAGILAAKKTPELLPLCHIIPLSTVDISFNFHKENVTAKCTVVGKCKTGVEMEALVGVCTALLAIWDMVKSLEKNERGQYPRAKITDVRVSKKIKEKFT